MSGAGDDWITPGAAPQDAAGDDWITPGGGRPAPEGFIGNAGNMLRGAGARLLDLSGGVVQAGAGLLSGVAPETAAGLARFGQEIAAPDAGYVPNFTWDRVKNSRGVLDAVGNTAGFVTEQAVSSLPEIGAAILGGPLGLAAALTGHSGRIAQERALNDGRATPGPADLAAAVPAAGLDVAADRLLVGRALAPAASTLAGRVAQTGRSVALGGATEGAQEGAEYTATNAGTRAGFNTADLLDNMAAGAVAGSGTALGAQGAVAAGRAVQGAVNDWITPAAPAVPPAPQPQAPADAPAPADTGLAPQAPLPAAAAPAAAMPAAAPTEPAAATPAGPGLPAAPLAPEPPPAPGLPPAPSADPGAVAAPPPGTAPLPAPAVAPPAASIPAAQPSAPETPAETTAYPVNPSGSETRSTPPVRAPRPQRRAESLRDYLAVRGGLRDDGGEVRAIASGRNPFVPGFGPLIRPDGGMAYDRALEAAIEDGYLPPGASVQDMLDAVDAELRGLPRSDTWGWDAREARQRGYQAEVDAERAAQARVEVQDVARDLGVALTNQEADAAAQAIVAGEMDAENAVMSVLEREPLTAREAEMPARRYDLARLADIRQRMAGTRGKARAALKDEYRAALQASRSAMDAADETRSAQAQGDDADAIPFDATDAPAAADTSTDPFDPQPAPEPPPTPPAQPRRQRRQPGAQPAGRASAAPPDAGRIAANEAAASEAAADAATSPSASPDADLDRYMALLDRTLRAEGMVDAARAALGQATTSRQRETAQRALREAQAQADTLRAELREWTEADAERAGNARAARWTAEREAAASDATLDNRASDTPAFDQEARTSRPSFYQDAWLEAGVDPGEAASWPAERQIATLAGVIRSRYGITVTREGLNGREAVDQLLDLHRNLAFMARALGMPGTGLAVDAAGIGPLRLVLASADAAARRSQGRAVLGSYDPAKHTITLAGRSNSFAHEWAHALDAVLAERLGKKSNLLSAEAAQTGLDPRNPVEAAFVRVLNALFREQAGLAQRVLQLQRTAAEVDASGNSTLRATQAQAQLQRITSGRVSPAATSSSMGQRAQKLDAIGQRAKPYFATPHEMLARAWESYMATRLLAAGAAGSESISMAERAYLSDADARLANSYPDADERAGIFAALDNLVQALQAEAMLPQGVEAAPDAPLLRPSDLDRLVPPAPGSRGLRAALRSELSAWTNLMSNVRARLGLPGSAQPQAPGDRGALAKAADTRFLTYSIRGVLRVMVARAPNPQARDALAWIADRVATDPGRGRLIQNTLEERSNSYFKRGASRMTQALTGAGLDPERLTDAQQRNLWDVLTGAAQPTGASISKAAASLRALLNQTWYDLRAAGVDVGYWERSGYMPRVWLDDRIQADPAGFVQDATRVYDAVFDQTAGAAGSRDPDAVMRALGDVREQAAAERAVARATPAGVNQPAPLDPAAALEAQRKGVVREIARLRRALRQRAQAEAAGDAAAQAAADAEIAKLDVDAIADAVRGVWSAAQAERFAFRVRYGDAVQYQTKGPESGFTKTRTLPPETDQIMRRWLETHPANAVATYLQQAARKIAYAEAFGADSARLEASLAAAIKHGASAEDVHEIRRIVNLVGGRVRPDVSPGVQRVTSVIYAVGTMALLPRAVWTSLAEPITTMMVSRDFQVTSRTLGYLVRGIVRDQGWRGAVELAQAVGIVTTPLYDTALMNRMSGNVGNTPKLDVWLSNFFRRTGLTQLTNAQKTAVVAGGNLYLHKMAQAVGSRDAAKALVARAELRELGIADADQGAFAAWMASRPDNQMPSPADLETPEGAAYGRALYRYTGRVIQEPAKVDRPELSAHPIGRLVFGLTSFSYAFWRNVEAATFLRAGRDARLRQDAGQGPAQAWAKSVGTTTGHATAFVGAMLAAQFLATAAREAIFNGDKWDERERKGELAEWLVGLSVSRMGLTGPLDPLVQAVTGLRYERDLSAIMAGAHMGYFLQAAQSMLQPFTGRNSERTNTAEWGATKGAYQFFGVPLLAMAATAIPAGPFSAPLIGLGMQMATSNAAADNVADALAGEKASRANARGGW